MLWTKIKDAAILAGLEPWLRPTVEMFRGGDPTGDDAASFALLSRLPRNAVCVDVGCNKGRFLDPMRKAAPLGQFFAFEPVPYLFRLLKAKYRNDTRVRLFNVALSSSHGVAEFYVNEEDMGLSGLSKRPGRMDPDCVTRIDVALRTLDEMLGEQAVDFIKIDVEGAEYEVLMGARHTIARSHPPILFEFGLGGADYFGVDGRLMFNLLESMDYEVYTVGDYVGGGRALSLEEFKHCFALNLKYNFVGAARST